MAYQHLHWAYQLKKLRGPAKPILVALADQADSDGTCWPGQQLLAEMTGVSTKTVERACQRLERLGLIERSRRNTANGYRTSDRFYLKVEVTPEVLDAALAEEDPTGSLTDTAPTRQSAYKAERLVDNLSGLTDTESGQREVPSLDPPEDPPVTPVAPTALAESAAPSPAPVPAAKASQPKPAKSRTAADLDEPDAADGVRFADFWLAYPRHDDRRRAENAWKAARRRATPAEIIAGAAAYAADPNREQAFTKQPATWLNADAWANDPLPPRYGTPTRESSLDRRDRQMADTFAALAAETEPTRMEITS